MDYELKPNSFNTIFSEKKDVENEAEYTLSDYMPSVSRIVKTEAKLNITDKLVNAGKLDISGEIVYTVLYTAENSGLLKCALFKEDFDEQYDMRTDTENVGNLCVFVKSVPIHATSKLVGQRTFAARSKFSLAVEVVDMSAGDFYIDERHAPECDVEYLRKDITASALRVAENGRVDISESFEIDADMPEISDIVDADAQVFVKSVSVSEDMVSVSAEMEFTCIYEARGENGGEYVSLSKTITFGTQIEMPDVDAGWKAVCDIKLLSLTCDCTGDNFGEQRVIEINAAADIMPVALKNTESTVIEDMYSTECEIIQKRQNVHITSLADIYTETVAYSDRVRFELRGISDIISSSLDINFGNPELSQGEVVIPAKGILSILGMKENGDTDARSSQISIRIKDGNIPPELFENKLRWINFCTVCHHECSISNGELVLDIKINENLAALYEETAQVITDHEKAGESAKNTKKCSFVLYYPENGESVWKVAKDHGVSCERVCAENDIDGKTFDGKKTVVLR
ncbi:MAG: DUF3794 domain-containing protein [Ruminococcaceae bacterium]|nr:DUF3794 domain-containing protein [Oscillospiraceae bacterium]